MRRALLVSWVSLVALSSSASARAEDDKPSFAAEGDLGFQTFDYAEAVPPPLKSTERGFLAAARAQLTMTLPVGIFASVSVGGSVGSTRYDGSTQTGIPAQTTTHEAFIEPEIDLGARVALRHVALGPYVGVGFKRWRRDILSEGELRGYLETYTWWQAPIGVFVEAFIGPRGSVRGDFAVMPSFGGTVDDQLSAVSAGLADVTVTMAPRLATRARVSFRYRLHDVVFSVTPVFEYWSFAAGPAAIVHTTTGQTVPVDSSGNVLAVREPDSRTFRFGMFAGATYLF